MIITPAQLTRRAELYHQLGAMIAAGVPLIQALEMAGNNTALRASRNTISALVDHLKNGLTFHDSMIRVHGWMPDFDIALLSAGEHSGRLDTCFKQLGTYYAMHADIIRQTIRDMLRTILTLNVLLLVFPLSLLIRLVQGIMNNNYGQCLPFFIEKIACFGLMYGLVFFLIFACQGKRNEKWRSIVEAISQIIPIYRTAQKYLVLSRLSAALEALVSSGISIVKGWPLAAAASGSPYLKQVVATWENPLETGMTPAELVRQTSYFPEMFANLYHTGEISGKLDESLARLQAYFRDEGFRTLQMFTRVLNGTIYGIVAVVVGYFVVSFWVGYFNAAMSGF
jgi:type II secretory pathway component PulF